MVQTRSSTGQYTSAGTGPTHRGPGKKKKANPARGSGLAKRSGGGTKQGSTLTCTRTKHAGKGKIKVS